MKLKLITLALASTLSIPAFASDWVMDKEASSLSFMATQSGAEFTGQFKTFDAKINFDQEALDSLTISVTIDMASVDTNAGDRDSQLPTAAWFDTSQFTTAIFESNTIRSLGGDNYEAEGKLSIKGIAQDVTLPFSLVIDGNKASSTGSLILDRLDYQVGSGDWANESMVGFPVTVSFSIEATSN